jgi:hypothetical protein
MASILPQWMGGSATPDKKDASRTAGNSNTSGIAATSSNASANTTSSSSSGTNASSSNSNKNSPPRPFRHSFAVPSNRPPPPKPSGKKRAKLWKWFGMGRGSPEENLQKLVKFVRWILMTVFGLLISIVL